MATLYGVATVAAVTRSETLADELRVLVRRYTRDPQYALTTDEALRICLVAAASRKDLNDWRDFAGDWLTELAFSDLNHEQADALFSHLLCLFVAVPELWVSSGRAHAALQALLGRI